MELRHYWRILRRRWLVALIPTVVVLAVGLATYRAPAPSYITGVQFIVGQEPALEADTADEQRYYAWLNSEYIADGVVNWATSGAFAAAVSERLVQQGHAIPPGAIQVTADNSRSLVTVQIIGGDPESLELMMDAAIAVLQEENAGALPQLGGEPVTLTQLNEPAVSGLPAGIRPQLELVLRIALAILAGIGLAFVVEYLDPTVRERRVLEKMGLPILGEIPEK
jgi:capsular polysaccharide biosynthesis protein